jgi:hypothetical protein
VISFSRKLNWVEVTKYNAPTPGGEKCVRLYKHSPDRWLLQVRGPLLLRNRREGRDFILASAYLSRADLEALGLAVEEGLRDDVDPVGGAS